MFCSAMFCFHLRGGGGEPKKNLDILEGIPKKWEFSNFHPSPPFIINERSLIEMDKILKKR